MPGHVPVSTVMSTHVVTVRSDERLPAILNLLDGHRISAMPIVDERNRPVGMVTRSDLLRIRMQGEIELITAAEVMTPYVVWLPPSAPIASAAAAMFAERMHHALVLAEDRRVVGILSSLDLLRWLAQQAGFEIVFRDGRESLL
jgi:CBS-domain-containing membrane protein